MDVAGRAFCTAVKSAALPALKAVSQCFEAAGLERRHQGFPFDCASSPDELEELDELDDELELL